MKLKLVSEDNSLLETCREVLADFEDSGWELDRATAEEVTPADFCIWDYRPGMTLPERADWESRHVFLVARGDLQAFGDTAIPGTSVLIKPITRPALAAYFARKATAFCDKGAPVDELLQSLIEVSGRLQESDSARTNFLTRAVHDCLTPVTTISGYSRLLCLPQFGSITERQAEVLARIQHSAERLSRLMSAVLQLTVRNAAAPPVRNSGDIRQCISDAIHEMLPFAKEKLITFEIDCDTVPETLTFDRSEVEQVLVSLLDNACKFTPRHGVVEIRGYEIHWDGEEPPAASAAGGDRNAFRVDVCDAGPAISPEHQHELFKEYKSYSGGRDRSGAGLGLAIARMLVERHRGAIWAASESTGTVFSFVLPLERAESRVLVEARG